MEAIYKEGRLTDFTIVAGDRELPAHQVILSARSPVFAAMLEPHTDEAKNSRVVFRDIDFEVMQELLLYMYSGRCPNLSTMALELLAAADRFQLPGLKDMADQVLRNGLMVESACRYLVFADMHNARELKADAVKFIAQNSSSVISTDGWAELVQEHPALVTEIVGAISNFDSRPASVSSSSSSPGMSLHVLRNGLMVESACRYLVFADMHNARELKADAVKFIAQNSSSVISEGLETFSLAIIGEACESRKMEIFV
ncbi:unnamed protein product [Gongylonema pulchrum]|uniref:BTB domain-containing protein n=1 Tax=Gongylonema pulchrum TaxID=637853 RepID=A0A3P7PAP6_9BILA|nr:unnamed protein product [Gongylonema pulchrum]